MTDWVAVPREILERMIDEIQLQHLNRCCTSDCCFICSAQGVGEIPFPHKEAIHDPLCNCAFLTWRTKHPDEWDEILKSVQ